jgi:hypothetical protein
VGFPRADSGGLSLARLLSFDACWLKTVWARPAGGTGFWRAPAGGELGVDALEKLVILAHVRFRPQADPS